MPDTDQIFKENFVEALKQLNQYVVLALASSASALALTLNTATLGSQQGVTVPGAFVAIDPHAARTVLLFVSFLAGALALYTAESANLIASQLRKSPDLLAALCTYPGFATSVYPGVRHSAALLPAFLSDLAVVIPAFHAAPVPWELLLVKTFFLSAPYLLLAFELRRPIGNAWTLVQKDTNGIER
jgi:hypothetical protein